MDRSLRGTHGHLLPAAFALVFLVMLTALMVSGCGSSNASSPTTETTALSLTTVVTQSSGANAQGPGAKVVIKDGKVDPTELEVAVGSGVTFADMDDDTTRTYHLVSSDGSFDTGVLGEGGSYVITFQKAGTIEYRDKDDSSIKGKIIVQ